MSNNDGDNLTPSEPEQGLTEEQLIQLNSPKQVTFEFEINSKKQTLPEMAGYIPEESEIENENKIEIEESQANQKSYKVRTWNRVGAKTGIVATVTATVISIFVFMGQFFTTALDNHNKDKPQEVVQIPTKVIEQDDEDVGALKTKLAVGSQLTALEKLNSKISTPIPTPKPTPSAVAISAPVAKPVPEATTTTITPQSVPKVVTITDKPDPVPKYKTISQVPAPLPQSVETVAQTAQPEPQTQIVRTQQIQRQSQRRPQTQKVASQPVNSSSPVTLPTPSNPDQNKGVFKVSKTEARKSGISQESNPAPLISTQKNGQSLIVGTHAIARLVTAIALIESSENGIHSINKAFVKGIKQDKNDQTYLIKLIQALKNRDGKEIIPKDSLLIAQVKFVSPEGWINLSVVSIVPNLGSGTVEKAIPEGAILVQARDGSPLKANIKVLSPSKDNTDTIAFSGISRTSGLPARHGIDPIHNESARRLDNKPEINSKSNQTNSNSNNKQFTPEIRIFTLNKDASLQIYINRSFSL